MIQPDLSVAVTQLMKGVVYRDTHDRAWGHLLQTQPQVRDHVAVLGLQVVIDEAEGYAFLRQRPAEEAAEDGGDPLPRLVPRRSLSFHVSLLLALLRKKLAEFDAQSGDSRLMLSRAQIASQVWQMNFDSDTNVVDVAIRRLRAKVDDPYPLKLIHTVRGMGYVLDVSA